MSQRQEEIDVLQAQLTERENQLANQQSIFNQNWDTIKAKLAVVDQHELEHQTQVKALEAQLNAMDSTALMARNDTLESKLRRLQSERDGHTSRIQQQDYAIQSQKAQILQLEDRLQGAAHENSKLAVGANQNAKA